MSTRTRRRRSAARRRHRHGRRAAAAAGVGRADAQGGGAGRRPGGAPRRRAPRRGGARGAARCPPPRVPLPGWPGMTALTPAPRAGAVAGVAKGMSRMSLGGDAARHQPAGASATGAAAGAALRARERRQRARLGSRCAGGARRRKGPDVGHSLSRAYCAEATATRVWRVRPWLSRGRPHNGLVSIT